MGVTEALKDLYDNFSNFIGDTYYFKYGIHPITLDLIHSYRDMGKYLVESKDYFDIGGLEVEDMTYQSVKIFEILAYNIGKETKEIKDS
jgi:hypothetical protein